MEAPKMIVLKSLRDRIPMTARGLRKGAITDY
jgi:hypothetical protein